MWFICPFFTRSAEYTVDDADPQFFVDLDMPQVRSQLKDCLDSLKPQAGQVELLCRFGKMVFRDIPQDLVGVALPSDAIYNIVRSRQLHYTFEGGAGIPENIIEGTIKQYKEQGEYSCKHVYYLSVLPDPSLEFDKRWRLDVMLERIIDPETEEASIRFIGVREPYMKPFKADIISLLSDSLDVRIAIRASPKPISADAVRLVQEFASTIRCASRYELEYPAKSSFRVTGCALKAVQTIRLPDRNIVVEVVQHEGQDSYRTFEFAATTIDMENVLGQTGAGVVNNTTAADAAWTAVDVLNCLDDIVEKSAELAKELSPPA
jgi:hypothetical protein